MFGWLVPMWLNSAWNFVASSASIGTVVGCIAVAAAVFSQNIIVKFAIPDLRKWAVLVAVLAFGYTTILGKGYVHGLAVKQSQWDASLAAEAIAGDTARSDAVRTVGPMPADRSMLRSDPFNRNSGTEPSCK